MIIGVRKLQMYMKSSHVFEPGATWSSGKKKNRSEEMLQIIQHCHTEYVP